MKLTKPGAAQPVICTMDWASPVNSWSGCKSYIWKNKIEIGIVCYDTSYAGKKPVRGYFLQLLKKILSKQ